MGAPGITVDPQNLSRLRFWLEVLVELSGVEPADCTFRITARRLDPDDSRPLMNVNLAEDIAGLDKLIGRPFDRETFGPLWAQLEAMRDE